MDTSYLDFLEKKTHSGIVSGEWESESLNSMLFGFQKHLTTWALNRGRAAVFADCGLGKTPIQLEWAHQISQKTNKKILILTPLAVSYQTVLEGEKFGIPCRRSIKGEAGPGITITNYEKLHLFNPRDFIGLVCDESSILKNFNGKTKAMIIDFIRKLPYRLLATATAAPNDYIELGTSSEALGELGAMDMLNRFFKNDQNNTKVGRYHGKTLKWRFKGYAEEPFWKWVCSWARALRKPSDIGFDDNGFILPSITNREYIVKPETPPPGMLFNLPAIGLAEERAERRGTIEVRCEKVAELVNTNDHALVWCHLNPEGDLLEKIIPDAVQVSGRDNDDEKESKLLGFARGDIRVLITKPKIGAWGLNFQNCNHVVFFASHSFEQYYQGVRRCWRFGQKRPVRVDIVISEGEQGVMANLQRKAKSADRMFDALTTHMNDALTIKKENKFLEREEVPSWL